MREKAPMSRFRLRSCVWEITLACCFSCAYCGSKAGRARENELTTEECLSVADQLAALGCRRVSMIGGEVFMRPDWDKIIARLTSRGVRV
ncbi:MAG: radical SAM protein, partial [Clostridia bacterium]|nr:radical SAM protein [Clostridia bacterium]